MTGIYFGKHKLACGVAAILLGFAAATASPALAASTKEYMVFFNWGSAGIPPSALPILQEIARSRGKTGVRFAVGGDCDTSETSPDALSLARAKSVHDGLTKLGISPSAFGTVRGFGTSDPLVKTGPNTREPQNRRAVILVVG